MNPYARIIEDLARNVREAQSCPLGAEEIPIPEDHSDRPKALVFSPHPDDECIVGALALRLVREMNMNVINVAVTQGSKPERQADRLAELQNACNYLGFGLVPTGKNGMEDINPDTRKDDSEHWTFAVDIVRSILEANTPEIIFLPHEHDWHPTHVGTHRLVLDALRHYGDDIDLWTVETEFWGQMNRPNVMIESSTQDVTDLVTALTFHIAEVERNPYHVRLPAWMIDNVRRGAELIGGKGGPAPDFVFATLYRIRQWHNGELRDVFDDGRFVSQTDAIGDLFSAAEPLETADPAS